MGSQSRAPGVWLNVREKELLVGSTLVGIVSYVTWFALISVSAALRLPNPVLRINSFSIAMRS
jgi:hypothetical protein